MDMHQLGNLLEYGQAFLTTVGKNPLFLVTVPGGYLLLSAVRRTGEAVRLGIAQGLRYRILLLFEVPRNVAKRAVFSPEERRD